MGFENMRHTGHMRFSHVSGALLICCLFLTYNWWSLSTQNYELIKQMDDMGEQLKICSNEKVSCISLKNNIDNQFREMENRMEDMKMLEIKTTDIIKKQKSEIEESIKTTGIIKQDLEHCQIELKSLKNLNESMSTLLASLKLEKDTFATKYNETRIKFIKLELLLNSTRCTTPKTEKQEIGALQSHILPTSSKPKPVHQDNPIEGYSQINNDPIQGGNHENYDDTVIENAANEDMDDGVGKKV